MWCGDLGLGLETTVEIKRCSFGLGLEKLDLAGS